MIISPTLIQKQLIAWLLVLLSFAGAGVNAAEEIRLNSTGQNNIKLLENTSSRLLLSNSISSFSTFFQNTEKGEFVELSVNSYSKTNAIGSPQLPVLSNLIEIPEGSTAEVRVVSYDLKEYKLADLGITQKLFPVQAPQSKNDIQKKPLDLNEQVYKTNTFFGETLARIELAGYMRGVQLANLILSPVEYNPVANTIRVYNDLVVEINFSGANKLKSEEDNAKTESPYYKSVFRKVLNFKQNVTKSEAITHVPVKYVIVSDPMFKDALQPFVKWKIKRGFNVIESYTNDPAVGKSLTSIKSYLQKLYFSATSADPAPTFVLFVGDVGQIPAFDCGDHVSDLYYCEYTGDYLPEVFYGRFSANTVAELLPQINKTLHYEQYLLPDPSFLKEVVMAAGADASHQLKWGNGQVNYVTENYFNQAHNIIAHTYLQPEQAGTNYSKNIQADISHGVSYANYSAHGSPEGWANPLFSISDVAKLNNTGKYGLIVGNSCQTNAYDQNSFGEALLRAENKGALGYIGASGLTYWDEDYWWSVGNGAIVSNPTYENSGLGAYDRIFHDQGEPRSEWYCTMGQMVFAGNLAVQESNSEMKKYYWEIYCLMGDPSTMVYFGVPAALSVNYEPVFPLGKSSFDVRTEPFASVAISKNGILSGVAEADENGLAVVTVNPFTEPGFANIVVTLQNRQPFIDSVKVAAPEGPYLVLKNSVIKDQDGNNNNLPESGEPLSVNIALNNFGKSDARKSYSTLSSTDTYFTIPEDTYYWPNIAGNSSSSAENAFKLQVSDDVPDMHTATFTVTTQTDSGSFSSTFNILIYAPKLVTGEINIDDSTAGIDNGKIDPGETLLVTVPVTNRGHSLSGEIGAQWFVFGDLKSSHSSLNDLGKLAPGESRVSTFKFKVSPDTKPGSSLSMYFVATAAEYNSFSTLTPVIGPQVEDFENEFLKFSWQFNGAKPWITTTSDKSEGICAAKSGAINNSERSVMYFEAQVLFNDTLSFNRKVSSESGYDYLRFYIDGAEYGKWSGNNDWLKVSYPVLAGNHTFSWAYEKDEATSSGLDAAWIDFIQFPAFSQVLSGPLAVKAFAVPDTICAGEQTTLYAFASGGQGKYSFTWTPSTKLRNSGIFNPSTSPQETTTYTVSVTDTLFTTQDDVSVTIEHLPDAPVITKAGDYLLSSSTAGNQWHNSQGLISGAIAQAFFPLTSGNYYVTITNKRGCSSAASNEVEIGFTGINPSVGNGFSVHPNPFTERLCIKYNITLTSRVKIVMYNSAGIEIESLDEGEKPAGNHEIFFNGSALAAGIYTCRIVSGYGVEIVKVIKN